MLIILFRRLSRRSYRSDVKYVIYIQSCMRRGLAKKELKALRKEARSVSKFKEISYKLENKVVELTQTLQKRTEEKKELQSKLNALELQLQQVITKHEESDARAKQFQSDLQGAQEELTRRDELLLQKEDVERRLADALAKAAEKEDAIQKLTESLAAQATQLESQQKAFDNVPVRNADDSSIILTLKSEVSNLREQLNRANALNSLTRSTRPEPSSPTFATGLRLGDPAITPTSQTNGNANGNGLVGTGRSHVRRHSSAGIYAINPVDNRTSADEMMIMAKRSQAANPRAVSVAYNGEDGLPRFRAPSGLSDMYDPAEEKIRLMQEIKRLDEDVLDGLIRGLKIPAPSTANPAAVKEILFPANLISLITNEMWKYGLIPESERFLANVMQTIQSHVMVSMTSSSINCMLIVASHSPLREKTRLYQGCSGSPTSTRCSRSFAWLRATCCKASAPARRVLFVHSSGRTTNASSPSSSTILTVLSTTSTTHGCWRPRNVCRRWSFLR